MTNITERELAEKIEDDGYGISEEGWRDIARTAAYYLGYKLAPEKPEPGSLGIVDGSPAYANSKGIWTRINADGSTECVYDVEPKPGRVVPAEPVHLTLLQAGTIWDRQRSTGVGRFDQHDGDFQVSIAAAMRAAIAKFAAGELR